MLDNVDSKTVSLNSVDHPIAMQTIYPGLVLLSNQIQFLAQKNGTNISLPISSAANIDGSTVTISSKRTTNPYGDSTITIAFTVDEGEFEVRQTDVYGFSKINDTLVIRQPASEASPTILKGVDNTSIPYWMIHLHNRIKELSAVSTSGVETGA